MSEEQSQERQAHTPPENPVPDVPEKPMPPEDVAGDIRAAAEKVSADTLASGEMPEPSAHVIEKFVQPHRPEPGPSASKEAGPAVENTETEATRVAKVDANFRDKAGESFDPGKHQHRAGMPELTPGGYLKRWGSRHQKAGLHEKPEGLGVDDVTLRNTEPPKKESLLDKAKRTLFGERPKESEPAAEAEPAPKPKSEPEFRNGGFIGQPSVPEGANVGSSSSGGSEAATAAAQLVAMEEMLAVMVFSEEWQFLSEERKGLVMAWTRAFEEKGIVETPWWMELGAAHAVILANRADKPKTREKLGKLKAGVMKRIIDMRTARAPKVKEVEGE